MSALIVRGTIVGKIQKKFKGKKGPFEIATYYVVNGEGKPIELKSIDISRTSGEEIECPVYMKFWRTEKSSGCDLVELTDN